jgi:hypothetical protein
MWVWGVVNAVLIMLVIYCNGRGWRSGWALGFAAQCWLILFGALGGGPWTFVFSTGPAIMFAVNWWLHPRRVARRFAADAAIVRAAVAASHEQPSPVLNARLGMSVEEAVANLTANAEKYLPHITLRDTPAYPEKPIHPWLAYDEEPATTPGPGMSTDMIASTGTLSTPPFDPPGGCLLCDTPVPQTELIGHLISHHPDVYDGTPFETWPVDDATTKQEGDHE